MKIGKIQISTSNSSLKIDKSKRSKIFEFIYYILAGLVIFIVPLVVILNVKGSKWINDFFVIVILLVLLFISLCLVVYNLKRAMIKYKPLILQKTGDRVVINGKEICGITQLKEITIQKMIDGDGGISYNVGLNFDQFYPLCLDQDKEEAISIASIIANYFEKEIKTQKGQMILP
jgi:hypothetical protein